MRPVPSDLAIIGDLGADDGDYEEANTDHDHCDGGWRLNIGCDYSGIIVGVNGSADFINGVVCFIQCLLIHIIQFITVHLFWSSI